MFVVYTSRVKGKALLAPNELSVERAASVPAAEDAASLDGGGVARAAAVLRRGEQLKGIMCPWMRQSACRLRWYQSKRSHGCGSSNPRLRNRAKEELFPSTMWQKGTRPS